MAKLLALREDVISHLLLPPVSPSRDHLCSACKELVQPKGYGMASGWEGKREGAGQAAPRRPTWKWLQANCSISAHREEQCFRAPFLTSFTLKGVELIWASSLSLYRVKLLVFSAWLQICYYNNVYNRHMWHWYLFVDPAFLALRLKIKRPGK